MNDSVALAEFQGFRLLGRKFKGEQRIAPAREQDRLLRLCQSAPQGQGKSIALLERIEKGRTLGAVRVVLQPRQSLTPKSDHGRFVGLHRIDGLRRIGDAKRSEKA